MESLTRRAFLAIAATVGATTSCSSRSSANAAEDTRLQARPAPPSAKIEPGPHKLGLGGQRDGFIYVPKAHESGKPMPLAVMMHGASNKAQAMEYTFALAEEFGVVVITPDSRGPTWDVILVEFGPDVRFIDSALKYAFARCAIDPRRLVLGGFSDGASYALSLGLANGDLFTHIVAFSPGFIASAAHRGRPRIFVSHGTDDAVLPIGNASRRLVPALRTAGYDVTYHEFIGPHAVPPPIARSAFEWLTQ